MAPFPRGADRGYAARRRRRFRGRASRGGLRQCLQVGVRARVPLWGVSFAVSESQRPDDLVCASSVGDRGRVLRGAAGSAIAVSLCLRTGGGVRMSRGWCVGALVRCSVLGWWMGIPGGRFRALRGASGVRRCPSPGRPSSGAGSQGSAARVSRVRSMRACGPCTGPTACALAGRRCRCGGGGRASPGGVPSTVVGGAWCQALSLPRLPVLWGGQPGFRDPCVPGAVDAGVWTRHRSHSVRPCGPALLAVGVAEGRPRGGVLSNVVRGAWCQALPLPWPSVLRSGQPGFRDPCVPGAVGAGVGTRHRPPSVHPCGPALRAVGVAEERPRGGRLPPL